VHFIVKKLCNANRAWSPPNASYVQKRYENRPMRIEDYEPGVSSLASQENNMVCY